MCLASIYQFIRKQSFLCPQSPPSLLIAQSYALHKLCLIKTLLLRGVLHPLAAIGGISVTHLSMPRRRVFNKTIREKKPDSALKSKACADIPMHLQALWEDFLLTDYLEYSDYKWQELTIAMVQRHQMQTDLQWRVGWEALWENPYLPNLPRTLIEEYYPGGLPGGKLKCVPCVCWAMGAGLEQCWTTKAPKYRQSPELPAGFELNVVSATAEAKHVTLFWHANTIWWRQKPRMVTSFDMQQRGVRYAVRDHLRKPLHHIDGIATACICIFCQKSFATPGSVLHHMRDNHEDKVHDGEDSWKKDMEALYNVKLNCLILRTWDFLGLTSVNLMKTTWVFNHWDIWALNSKGRIGVDFNYCVYLR